MATKKLARELGLLRQRSSSSSGSKKQLVSNQIFSFIIVIDFESTCWKEKNNYSQEIIEFPAVLLNTSTGEVESEFHSYVQPQEHPTLSNFCTELTGITQAQVEAGLPLQIVLSRFSRWLQVLQQQKGLVFPNRPQHGAPALASQKLCTFLTWSDWDLGVCLLYECKRKQINKPSVLCSWIDLRSTYRLFYNRKPKGLNGALQDLGIQFEGREHSGLDDARNTAQLAARMTREGCVLRITRSLDRTPMTCPKVLPAPKTPTEHDDPKARVTTSKPSACPSFHHVSDVKDQTLTSDPQNSVQSLVSPKTLLNGTLILREDTGTSANLSAQAVCAVTLVTPSTAGPAPFLHLDTAEGPFEEFFVEGEERCGSYDDVVLDFSEFESANYTSEESVSSSINSFGKKITESNGNPSKSGLETCFALPKIVGKSRSLTRKESPITSMLLNKSEISFRNAPKPHVLVPNTPSFRKPPKRSFSIFTEREDPSASTSHTSTSVLSALSVNASLNTTGTVRKGGCRITSPLCSCGRRAKRQLVTNGGPNQGRAFFCCPGRRLGGGTSGPRGCGFFKWESALFQKSGLGVAAVGGSVSLCLSKTALYGQLHSTRKSW